MLSEKQLLLDLQIFIQKNIDAYLKLHQTGDLATSNTVKNVIEKAAHKRALLVRELADVYHSFTSQHEDMNCKMLIPERLLDELNVAPQNNLSEPQFMVV